MISLQFFWTLRRRIISWSIAVFRGFEKAFDMLRKHIISWYVAVFLDFKEAYDRLLCKEQLHFDKGCFVMFTVLEWNLQGSVISLTVFNIMVTDFCLCADCSLSVFADGLSVLKTYHNLMFPKKCETGLKNSVVALCNRWNLRSLCQQLQPVF